MLSCMQIAELYFGMKAELGTVYTITVHVLIIKQCGTACSKQIACATPGQNLSEKLYLKI